MTYTLIRLPSTTQGTFGTLYDDDHNELCKTAELPWNNNTVGQSCIPTGQYQVVPHNTPEHPQTWELQNVPGRSNILIHNGNVPDEDSEGCILVGNEFGAVEGYPAVLNSDATLDYLREVLPDNFTLTIINGD